MGGSPLTPHPPPPLLWCYVPATSEILSPTASSDFRIPDVMNSQSYSIGRNTSLVFQWTTQNACTFLVGVSGIINCTYKKCIFKRHESCYLSINVSDLMMKILLPIFEQLCVVDSRVLQSVNRLERIYWYYICTKDRAYEKKSECYWKEALKSLLRFWKRDLNILLYGHKSSKSL